MNSPRLLYSLDEERHKPIAWERSPKIRLSALPTQGRAPECWWCGEAEQSVQHLYTKCRRWRKETRKLVRKLYSGSVRWQAQARTMVAS